MRVFLSAVASLGVLGTLAGAERPNVLFIAADDLRNDLGCLGHPLARTPNLDRLAAEGVLFRRAYCQQALCNPSRASLLTGRRPDTLGIWDLPTHFREVDAGIVTLPQQFKRNGYFTQNVGKIFHNWRQKIEGDPESWSVPARMHFANHGSDVAKIDGGELAPDSATAAKTERRDLPDEAYFDGRIAAEAVHALAGFKDAEQPFFLAVGFWKPHLPFNAPKRYWDMYDRRAIHAPESPNPPENGPPVALHNGRELLGEPARELTADEVIELRHGYLAGVSYLDAQVGKLLDALDRNGLRERTVVVFWSDHGFHLGEHGLWCKTSNHELDAKVPLIIAPPGRREAGAVTDSLVELLDLYPTLTDLCGLPTPRGVEGVSLVPVLNDPTATVKPAAFTQHPRPAYFQESPEVMGVSARTDRFRYTEWRDHRTGAVVAAELYDHAEDPGETRNVIDSPPDQEGLEEAKRELAKAFPKKATSEPHTLKYNVPGATADLGVGLWAWPMPMDWNGNGHLDLVVSCPDVPYGGTYVFENPGDGGPMPVFRPAVKVGPKLPNATVSYVDGRPRVLVPGREIIDFREHGFEKFREIYPSNNVHENRVRANQWRYVDYDGDGALDLIVGVGDWTDYGWDDAFDERGRWTRGPLHGYVYLARNEGTTEEPRYAEPLKLRAGGKPIDVFGMPSPNFADFDGDGDLDLICGEFLDGFTYFENVGTRREPVYAEGRRLTYQGSPLAMDLQMIVPVAIDWDGDGDVDLIVGDEDGRVAFVENTGRLVDGVPEFLPPKYFRHQADEVKFGALVTPFAVDWDGDGDEDLICGNTAGRIAFVENLGGNPPRWAEPKLLTADGEVIRIQAGPNGSIQGPAEAKWGYTTLSVADWNHNGLPDVVVNSIWGRVEWFENVGTRTEPKLAAARPVRVAWPEGERVPRPAWNWWQPRPDELVTQWRTTPFVIDLDCDGLNDLVMLDHEGYLAFYKRQCRGDDLVLTPGRRVFTDEAGEPLRLNDGTAGKSGRRKFCLADWDGDGKLDLLVNGRNVDWYRNVSTEPGTWVFRASGPLDDRHLAGHTTSPTVVHWARDGRPDLLIGGEDGRLYFRPNPNRGRTP